VKEYIDVPAGIVRSLRAACAHLPEAREEPAFAGVRWRIRGRTLVHAVTKDSERGPITYITFHAAGEELDALVATGDPFFPGWGAGLVSMILREDGTTDWAEVKEVVTESYSLLAPKKLIARLGAERPGD
jgi:hypothetical protein